MADVEILASQVSAAPLRYAIPGGLEILVKVLAASFDGSGAGGSWQPAIQIVAGSGQVLRTFPLATALAAGASADVTWFPAGGVTGTGTGTGTLVTAAINGTGIALAASPNIVQITFVAGATHYATNDDGSFYAHLKNGITIKQPGLYLLCGATSEGPVDATFGAVMDFGRNSGNIAFGNADMQMNERIIEKQLPATSMPLVQKDFGIYAVQASDVAGDCTAELWARAPSGWAAANADHNITVTRLGPLGSFPPLGFD